VSDQLADGRRFRVLTAVDHVSRECVYLKAAQSLPSHAVTEALDEAMSLVGQLKAITMDNGTELACNHFDQWAYHRGIQLDFVTPGRPVENGIIESFNGRLRDECLNVLWFESLADARAELAAWQAEYNEARPHSSLGNRAPAEYIAELLGIAAMRGGQRAEALTQCLGLTRGQVQRLGFRHYGWP
jgi:putative transposase